jgi:hypothetical protein
MSAVGEPARERPALRVALVAGDPIRHQGLMAIIRGGGHAVVEHQGEADVVLVDGESIDQYGAPAVTLGRADCGQAGALPADATAVQIDAALLAAAAGLMSSDGSPPSAPTSTSAAASASGWTGGCDMRAESARSQRATMVDSIYHESILFPNNSCVSSWQDG